MRLPPLSKYEYLVLLSNHPCNFALQSWILHQNKRKRIGSFSGNVYFVFKDTKEPRLELWTTYLLSDCWPWQTNAAPHKPSSQFVSRLTFLDSVLELGIRLDIGKIINQLSVTSVSAQTRGGILPRWKNVNPVSLNIEIDAQIAR